MLVRKIVLIAAAVFIVSQLLSASSAAAAETRTIAFPVQGPVTFHDDFGDPRSGHRHEGNDLMGAKMQPLLAAVDGTVRWLAIPEASWGYEITLEDADGWTYNYIHVNNDTPGTDDGLGGLAHAYAPGIEVGARVTKGQLVGWMGDSGNAESVGPHLHFEIRRPDDVAIDPYQSLLAARDVSTFDPVATLAASTAIDADRGIPAALGATNCEAGSRIKSASSRAVYYCGRDGKRYVFPNDRTYKTWFADFNGVTTVSAQTLASIPLGGNVTYRPGAKLVKIQSDPKVYAVDRGGLLRWVETPEVAAALYGARWKSDVDDVSDAFFINYRIGDPIAAAK